jgi:hypothetical protein
VGPTHSIGPAERRRLGARYLHAYVTHDDDELDRLVRASDPLSLLAAIATAARAMAMHVADLENATPEAVTGAYRDVWC